MERATDQFILCDQIINEEDIPRDVLLQPGPPQRSMQIVQCSAHNALELAEKLSKLSKAVIEVRQTIEVMPGIYISRYVHRFGEPAGPIVLVG